jgi:Holliday junction resolvasome RuvABC DNA-binding subunit
MEELDFEEVKKWLQYGDIAELAKQFGISRNAASAILNKRKKNFKFMAKLIERATENKLKMTHGLERLKGLGV